jgi:hypothetical protein
MGKNSDKNLIPTSFIIFSTPISYSVSYHHSSYHTTSSTDFTELVQPTEAPSTPTSSIISPPENTPIDGATPKQPLPPQLSIHSVPIEEDILSLVDYNQEAKTGNPDDPPAGFIVNDPDSHHYYPVYVPNPMYGNWDEQDCTKVARYIQYKSDYTYVTGTEGQGYSQHTIPVTDLQGPPSGSTQSNKIRDLKSLARQYARDRGSCDDTRISYLEYVESEAEADWTLARMIAG